MEEGHPAHYDGRASGRLVGLSFSVKKEQRQILEMKLLQDFFSELMLLGGSSVLVTF